MHEQTGSPQILWSNQTYPGATFGRIAVLKAVSLAAWYFTTHLFAMAYQSPWPLSVYDSCVIACVTAGKKKGALHLSQVITAG